ncbi:hypothetical protein SISNIDRAFT_483145 [Sistotremastrum niveocremeum HHB9708]|uniref:Uncharacterized protein n=1 Tax=Sistotremastrum niveocremeum HHB9708 TaxID=1314777 RepID=A0A164Y564_9AGAM|nr:hypothetical protein SISNIDRAFT_483145 [Sistotremastrum niveocremeum HHB9708]
MSVFRFNEMIYDVVTTFSPFLMQHFAAHIVDVLPFYNGIDFASAHGFEPLFVELVITSAIRSLRPITHNVDDLVRILSQLNVLWTGSRCIPLIGGFRSPAVAPDAPFDFYGHPLAMDRLLYDLVEIFGFQRVGPSTYFTDHEHTRRIYPYLSRGFVYECATLQHPTSRVVIRLAFADQFRSCLPTMRFQTFHPQRIVLFLNTGGEDIPVDFGHGNHLIHVRNYLGYACEPLVRHENVRYSYPGYHRDPFYYY